MHPVKKGEITAPSVKTAAVDGSTVDTRGFASLEFSVITGAIAGDGDFGVVIQESSNGTDWAAATDTLGVFPATLEADTAYRCGYVGGKRYARINVTKAGGTSIALSAVAMLGHPSVSPVA